jgi:hypothetical protein
MEGITALDRIQIILEVTLLGGKQGSGGKRGAPNWDN